MNASSREGRLATAFVSLADTLVDTYDVVDILNTLVDTCADLIENTEVGLVLADPDGELSVVAATADTSRAIELLQLQQGGPCLESFRSKSIVDVPDVGRVRGRWPEFSALALERGVHAVHSVPLRLRGDVLGALGLFRIAPEPFTEEDFMIARGLADIATIGILQERALRQSDLAREQLQLALESRIVIEQAKGVLAQTHGIEMDEAFKRLRDHARSNRIPLTDVATDVVRRRIVP